MSESLAPFIGPRAKLARSKTHIAEVERHCRHWIEQCPVGLYIDLDSGPEPRLHLGMVSFIPLAVSLAFGDAVHAMRAALDLLAVDLVKLNGKQSKNVSFPFAKNAAELGKQIKNHNFDRAGTSYVQLLREIAPYTDGNEALRGLHDLDITDKHQVILPTYPKIFVPHLKVHFQDGAMVEIKNCDFPPDLEIALPGMPMRIEVVSPPEVRVIFNGESPNVFFGKALFETLHDLAQMVLGIIEAFELLALGHTSVDPEIGPITLDAPLLPRPMVFVRDTRVMNGRQSRWQWHHPRFLMGHAPDQELTISDEGFPPSR